MNIHEYQAKELLSAGGVAVPPGRVAYSAEEAAGVFERLGVERCVIKAQIHAGGRGKGRIYAADNPKKLILDGGVKTAGNQATVKAFAQAMLGNILVTKQTGAAGRVVRRVYVEAAVKIAGEAYVGVVVDRVRGLPALMVCTEGGVEIEETAAQTPEKILRLHFAPNDGLRDYQARQAAFFLGLSGEAFKSACRFLSALAKTFVQKDASLVEINPFAVTTAGGVVALDAKINFDDNALYRHADVAALRDVNEEDPIEAEARAHDLSYVALDGNIGCLVNGAGLAMGTMDAIQLNGGKPANFLDIGGTADEQRVAAAFRIILSDPKVKAVLVNVFGGIVRCDLVAGGIAAAAKAVGVKVPLIVRLAGTRAAEGRKILVASGSSFVVAETLGEAAAKAAAVAQA
jgi:succinyl-CoA synthetase beta subunit